MNDKMTIGRVVFGPVPCRELPPRMSDRLNAKQSLIVQFANVHACSCIGPQPGQTKCPCALRAESQQGETMIRAGVTINGRRYRLVPVDAPAPTVAEAWRDGRNACAVSLRRQARDLRARASGDLAALANASTLEIAADALAEMEPKQEGGP